MWDTIYERKSLSRAFLRGIFFTRTNRKSTGMKVGFGSEFESAVFREAVKQAGDRSHRASLIREYSGSRSDIFFQGSTLWFELWIDEENLSHDVFR